MPAVLIHGVPDTGRLWDSVRRHLKRTDVVAPSLPGFGAPVPSAFAATKEAYADWIVAELERIGEPVDLVGHDWGAILVQRIVSTRPDLIRTWACGSGVVDVEYAWHDAAVQWQTPEVGEQFMALMTPEMMEQGLVAARVPAEAARESTRHVDATMKDCILRLYRSAVHVGREWQSDAGKSRRALVLWGADDPYGEPRFAERLAARVGARLCMLEGCGHWWPLERPAEVAAELERHWSTASR